MPEYTIDGDEGTVTISSLTKIVLQVGDNSITLAPDGITIVGMNISQTAELQATVECVEAQVTASGVYTNDSTLIQLGE